MQLYLARIDRVDVQTPEEQFDENNETVRLVDGHRGTEVPLIYIKRPRMPAGEYLIFYRAAFRYPAETPGKSFSDSFNKLSPAKLFSPKKSPKKQVPGYQMDDFTDLGAVTQIDTEAPFYHDQRKLVLSLNFPNNSKL